MVIEIARNSYSKNGYYSEASFRKDIYILFIIKKMLSRFLKMGELNDKLLINNIVILTNVFGIGPTNQILRIAMDDLEFSVVKSILLFLNCFILEDDTPTNEIMDGILQDMSKRYNLRNPYVIS